MVMERSISGFVPLFAQPAVARRVPRRSRRRPRRGTALGELPYGLGLHQLVQAQGLDLRGDRTRRPGRMIGSPVLGSVICANCLLGGVDVRPVVQADCRRGG